MSDRHATALDEVIEDLQRVLGLRKATMRRMAEQEMPNKTMKSVSGHSKDDEVARYTEAANQERLAQGALTRLAAWEMSNHDSELDKHSA